MVGTRAPLGTLNPAGNPLAWPPVIHVPNMISPVGPYNPSNEQPWPNPLSMIPVKPLPGGGGGGGGSVVGSPIDSG